MILELRVELFVVGANSAFVICKERERKQID